MSNSTFNLDLKNNEVFKLDDFRKLCENQIYFETHQTKKQPSFKKLWKKTDKIQKKIQKLEYKILKLKSKL